MDHQVDSMKFCGIRLNLLGFSSFLSVLGIVFGFVLGIGGLFVIESGASLPRDHHLEAGGVLISLMIHHLIMWILLKIYSSKQNIPGIEGIGKVYSYVFGVLDIIGGIVRILFSCMIQYPISVLFRSQLSFIQRFVSSLPA